jgi:hypothetical protein
LTFQAASSPRPQEIVFPPVLAPELMPFPFLARHMTARLEDYMRVVEQRRLAQINRGATQDTIERCTFPHKYKQVGYVTVTPIVAVCKSLKIGHNHINCLY